MIEVTFVAKGPSTGYEEVTMGKLDMPSVPEKGEEVEMNDLKYGVIAKRWRVHAPAGEEGLVAKVTVVLQERG